MSSAVTPPHQRPIGLDEGSRLAVKYPARLEVGDLDNDVELRVRIVIAVLGDPGQGCYIKAILPKRPPLLFPTRVRKE